MCRSVSRRSSRVVEYAVVLAVVSDGVWVVVWVVVFKEGGALVRGVTLHYKVYTQT